MTGGGCSSGSWPTWPPGPSSSPPRDVTLGGISWSWLQRCFTGTRSSVRLSRRAHAEVRALLQFHAGGTKNNGRHRHRKSCLGFNGEPHGFVALFLFSAPKLLQPGYFPRNHCESALSQSGQGSSPNIPLFPFMVIIWPLRGEKKKGENGCTEMQSVGFTWQVVP